MLWLALGVAFAGPSQITATGATVTVGSPEITVTAERAKWDLTAKRGDLSGGVLAVQGDLKLQCNSATVELGVDQGIVRAVAIGNVRVTQGDKSATGGKAVLADGRLELTESPTLSTDIHQMTGSRIVFVVGEQSIECDDCTVRVGSGD